MELKGKRVAFLGDSITQGVGASCRPPVQMPHSASRAWDEQLQPPV